MNRSLFFITVICIIIAAIVSYFIFTYTRKQHDHAYYIAIFEPASHPSINEIAQGITDTMKKEGHHEYIFDRYNANHNKTLQRAQAEEIVQQNYDLIAPIGSECTRLVHELTTKKHLSTPIVFDAVSDPVSLGVVASMQSSGNNVTGVEDVSNIDDQLEQLLQLVPAVKNILLVYDPVAQAGAFEKKAEEMKRFLEPYGVSLHKAKIYQTNELQTKVQPLLNGIDVMMILTDHTVVSGVDLLITLCNRYGIILYASELNSGEKGAALCYGVSQYELGVQTARLALRILEGNEKPTNLPVKLLSSNIIQINTKTMRQQKLMLSDEQLAAIKNKGGVII